MGTPLFHPEVDGVRPTGGLPCVRRECGGGTLHAPGHPGVAADGHASCPLSFLQGSALLRPRFALGLHRRDPIFPDLAFSLPLRPASEPSPGAAIGTSAQHGSPREAFSFDRAPTGSRHQSDELLLPRIGAWPEIDERRYERYRRVMLEFTTYVLEQGDSVHLLSSELGCDYHAFDDLARELRNAGRWPMESACDRAHSGSFSSAGADLFNRHHRHLAIARRDPVLLAP